MQLKRSGKQGARPSPGNKDIFGEAAVDFETELGPAESRRPSQSAKSVSCSSSVPVDEEAHMRQGPSRLPGWTRVTFAVTAFLDGSLHLLPSHVHFWGRSVCLRVQAVGSCS